MWPCWKVGAWRDVVWCEAVVVRCGMYNTLPLRHQITSLTFQTTPHSTSHHHSSPYRVSYHTTIPHHITHISYHTIIPHHITHFILHHSSPYHTFHITPSFFSVSRVAYHWHRHLSQHVIPLWQCHWHFISHHILATLCITPPHLTLHPISYYVPHNATFHVPHATFEITPYIGHIVHYLAFHHIQGRQRWWAAMGFNVWERETVCVCLTRREREGVCVRERKTPVSVCERDGVCDGERERRCVCVSVCERDTVCVFFVWWTSCSLKRKWFWLHRHSLQSSILHFKQCVHDTLV